MHGRIDYANNDDGPGSTFWFEVELPTVTVDDVKDQPVPPPPTGGGANILLVEDLPMNQELACAILGRAGHLVAIANDGLEAVEAVQANAFDLVLMDIQMPRMDGVTATRCIRELDGPAKNVPIIAMTANALPEQVRAFREAGMDGHLAKPFRQQDLHEVIRQAFENLARPTNRLPPQPSSEHVPPIRSVA